MRYIYLVLLFQGFVFLSSAQNLSVKGHLIDALNRNPLINASVTLLNAKDSILVSDSNTDNSGSFVFSNLNAQEYILLFSFSGYQDKSLVIDLKNQQDLDTIFMSSTANDLDAVIVKADRGAIKINGDTIEYNSKFFKVPKNASVEDLLKRLPGIRVDNSGKITAQGEEVKKILVDGDEFFNDDPTLVTNNLRAKMVDKVQVFDKKSEQSTFSGLDDGVREKTINLKLNEDSKSGYFGSAELGIGTKEKYDAKITANYFTNDSKLSVFGVKSNNGISGLSSVQNYRLGFNNKDGYSSQYNGKGIPNIFKTGVHFDDKTKDNVHKLRINYVYENINVDGKESSFVQNNIESGTLFNRSSSGFSSRNQSNKGDLEYTFNMSPSSYLKLNSDFSITKYKSEYETITHNTNNVDSLLSSSLQNLDNSGDTKSLNIELNFAKRFKKAGRTLMATLQSQNSKNASTTFLENSTTDFGSNSQTSSYLNQSKDKRNTKDNYSGGLIYTEPLSSHLSLISQVGVSNSNERYDIYSYDQNVVTDGLDSNYSSSFRLHERNMNIGFQFNYKKDKVNLNLGTKVEENKLDLSDLLTSQFDSRSYINWTPHVGFKINYSVYQYLNISYNGNSVLPTMFQLQPLVNNEDPLVVYVGNKDLMPSFKNQIDIKYMNFKVISGVFLGATANIMNYRNNIGSVIQTDNSGRTLISFQNIPGMDNYQYNLDLNYGRKYSKPDLVVSAIVSVSGNHYSSIVNQDKSITDTKLVGIGPYITFNKDSLVYISLRSKVNYNLNNFGNSIFEDEKFMTFDNDLMTKLFWKGFELSNQLSYRYEQKTFNFPRYTKLLWNATLSYNFRKLHDLTLNLTCFDILNQNDGYERVAQNNRFIINNYSTIKRYLMASIVWRFNNFGQDTH